MTRARRAITISLIGIVLTSCAGGSLNRVSPTDSLPSELGKEMAEKFEVRESEVLATPAPAPPAAPVASPSAVVAVAKKKAPAPSPKPLPKKPTEVSPGPVATAPVPAATPSPAAGGFQFPSRRPQRDPIWLSERHIFEVTYFGMVAGEVKLEIMPHKMINNRKVYHVHGHAESSKVFSLFYKLNDTIESYIDFEGLFSHRFQLQLDESKQTRNSIELYDSEKGQTFYWNRWNHHKKGYVEQKEFFPMVPFSQDSLSALFFIRMQPLKTGDVFTFPVISEGKNWDAVVTVVRREVVDTPMGRKRAIVLKPETKYQGVLKKQGDSFIWLTDDDRRTVLRLEAKVRIGTVIATLKEFHPGIRPAQH